ncbi:hypothetical protein DXA99_06990 [Eubacterium sp. OF10-16]|nr:hypothetical protein DWX37_05500 [Eubacterium sp. AF19-17]RJW00915.1 hypothetical protein DW840_01985 [Eubacterium sp. AM35-6AC]RJW47658.1 hypothetical protein DXA99_06990 [Eubacterium sp. OF10-16]BCT46096.1 hypothetical protein L3BBH23_25410 [Longicatena caecimuris]
MFGCYQARCQKLKEKNLYTKKIGCFPYNLLGSLCQFWVNCVITFVMYVKKLNKMLEIPYPLM